MDDEIPSVDIRVRVRLLEWKRLPELQQALNDFLHTTGIEILENDSHLWLKAILLVQNPKAFDLRNENQGLQLTQDEKEMLELDREPTKTGPRDGRRLPSFERNRYARWRHLPWEYWKIMINCALAAITQGCSEIVVNAAQQWYQVAFHIFIDDTSLNDVPYPGRPGIFGLINGAPYLCCVVSIWLTPWLNRKLGRRGTIFWSSFFSILSPILQAISRNWWELFIFRLLMGVGIGPKSATIPIYIAEVAPASIRGSLVMFWQVFTALGIMLGSVAGVVLQRVGDASNTNICGLNDSKQLISQACSLNWRLMLATPFVPALFLFLYIYSCHESSRWLVAKAHAFRDTRRPETAKVHYKKAYRALEELSRHRILAARDILSHYYLLDEEAHDLSIRQDRNPRRLWFVHRLLELFGRRRNRRAILASSINMFAQQFCGVNLIVYYSNYAFARISSSSAKPNFGTIINGGSQARLDFDQKVLLYTMGFGLINFFFASPAFFMIDTVGRRTLLLCTLPLLCLSNLITAAAFAPNNHPVGPAIALTGMYLFGVFYSFGLGPIPFVYAAESVPLYCREVSVALVVSINWLFNWVLAFTGPLMFESMKPAGTFGFYSAWCAILTIMVLFLVPETRLLKLEEVDFVFHEVKARDFGSHAKETLLWQLHLGKEPDRLYKSAEERILGARDPANEPHQGRPLETGPAKDGTETVERVASTSHETTQGRSPRSDRTLTDGGFFVET